MRYWQSATLADGTEVVVGVTRVRGAMSHDRAFALAESLAARFDDYEATATQPEEKVFV